MAETRIPRKPNKRDHRHPRKSQSKQVQSQKHPRKTTTPEKKPPPPSWEAIRSLFTCKHHHAEGGGSGGKKKKKCGKAGCSGSLCRSRDGSRVTQRPETTSPESQKKWVGAGGRCGTASRDGKATPEGNNAAVLSSLSSLSSSSVTAGSSSSSSSVGGSFRGLRRLSGCYECHMVVDPVSGLGRDSSLRIISPCPDCGEIFTKAESLELHQAIRHAVLELGPEDNSRNIVEIIFQSSWLKKQAPICKIDRILKVNNTQKTITRFEDYRDSIRSKASKLPKKHPRCAADGNELLRFHCAPLACSLGTNRSTNLCHSAPHCSVCSIIKDGFKADGLGKICTMATSGRAHDAAQAPPGDNRRAMLVCRVIAGRVKKTAQDSSEDYDSISGPAGAYSSLDELFVFNTRAILPCFVVIYGGF